MELAGWMLGLQAGRAAGDPPHLCELSWLAFPLPLWCGGRSPAGGRFVDQTSALSLQNWPWSAVGCLTLFAVETLL